MHNTWLIVCREYIERVRTRGFVITTVLIPLLMGLVIATISFMQPKGNGDTRIAVVSSDTQLALDLEDELEHPLTAGGTPNTPTAAQSHIVADAMDIDPSNIQAERNTLDNELDSGELDGYLWITPAAKPGQRPTFTFTPRQTGEQSLRNKIAAALGTVLVREQLSHRGIVAADADAMLQPVEITAVSAPRRQNHESATLSVSILFFLMYMVIMLYGMNVARSIIEEKTSRVFEVMLATIRPEEMMAGKIVGVGAVGLTQVGIWLSAGAVAAGAFAMKTGGRGIQITLTAPQIFFFIIYFVLGYLLYSSVAAALGAMTNSEQELQQLNLFLVLPLVFCFLVAMLKASAPDSGLVRVLALIPPFTPLLMYLRVSLGHPAPWEIMLSLVLTLACIWAVVWVTSRIYRVGVLMYGKRPNLPEILRWLKYS